MGNEQTTPSAAAAPNQKSGECPVDHSKMEGCPIDHDQMKSSECPINSEVNPHNMMPPLNQNPSPGQPFDLSKK